MGFNHNKLDEYKKAMEILGLEFYCFHGYLLEITPNFYSIQTDEESIKSTNWEDFKIKVAEYFLNK